MEEKEKDLTWGVTEEKAMLFISAEAFFEKTKDLPRLSREEERALFLAMKAGDAEAREKLIRGYLPQVAGHIRALSPQFQKLELVMRCCAALERAVHRFDFGQDSESFDHHLSWVLRQTTTGYIAER